MTCLLEMLPQRSVGRFRLESLRKRWPHIWCPLGWFGCRDLCPGFVRLACDDSWCHDEAVGAKKNSLKQPDPIQLHFELVDGRTICHAYLHVPPTPPRPMPKKNSRKLPALLNNGLLYKLQPESLISLWVRPPRGGGQSRLGCSPSNPVTPWIAT